jgi:hypothetical protein
MRAFNVCKLEHYSYGSFCVASKSDFVWGTCLPRQYFKSIKFFVDFHYYSGSQTVLHGDQRLHKLFSGNTWVSPQMIHFKYTGCSYWTQETFLTVTLSCNTAANKLYWQNPFESKVQDENQDHCLQTKQVTNNFQFMLWKQSIILSFRVFDYTSEFRLFQHVLPI